MAIIVSKFNDQYNIYVDQEKSLMVKTLNEMYHHRQAKKILFNLYKIKGKEYSY